LHNSSGLREQDYTDTSVGSCTQQRPGKEGQRRDELNGQQGGDVQCFCVQSALPGDSCDVRSGATSCDRCRCAMLRGCGLRIGVHASQVFHACKVPGLSRSAACLSLADASRAHRSGYITDGPRCAARYALACSIKPVTWKSLSSNQRHAERLIAAAGRRPRRPLLLLYETTFDGTAEPRDEPAVAVACPTTTPREELAISCGRIHAQIRKQC